MEFLSRIVTRKKFLFVSTSVALVLAFFGLKRNPVENKVKMKFLTRDGKLVEIDADKLPTAKRVASKSDIQQWIK